MPAYLVFNELSLAAAAANERDGQRYLDGLSEILIDQRIGLRRILVGPAYLLQLQVSDGYSVGRWLSQYSPEDRERRVRVKTLIDRRIDFDECLARCGEDSRDAEYRCQGEIASGLATALRADGLAVSLSSAEQWNATTVEIEELWLGENEINTCARPVLHACKTVHLEAHGEWLRRVQAPPPANGVELWEQRATLFPNVDFCESVEPQIRSLGGNQPRFKATARGLRDLQDYCDSWHNGNFDIHRVPHASGESTTTLNMYSEERTFRCPDGQYRVFEWHLKRGDTRIHFLDFPGQKRLLVGYVGAHLRISSE